MTPEIQLAVARELPLIVAGLLSVAGLALMLLGLMLGWLLRGRAYQVTVDQLADARSEQLSATKLAALRAERKALGEQVERLEESVARYRRGDMARDNIVRGA